jgi:lipoprotein-anchoring transpeptidase ErfK/SrfK
LLHRIALTLLVAAAFGAAVPAAGVALPVIQDGVEVGGVPVGGMISVAAERRVAEQFGQPVRLSNGDESWAVGPAKLGASASVREAVARAVNAKPDARIRLRIEVRQASVRRYVARLNRQVAVPPRNSRLVGLSNLAPAFTKAKPGRALDQATMVRWITRALQSTWRGVQLELKFRRVAPEVTPGDYGAVIVIRRGSNHLYLYDGPSLVRTFGVATGRAKYPTPIGSWEIVVKERDPTWDPPDSEWAKDAEPIPPGPGNPLGTRWMGLSATAVGIHGTPDAASIGYSASHGCIRMKISEAEWLFDHVDVGTPVYIVSA